MAQRTHKTVLFLCSTNSHHGRFAEALFNSVAGKMGLPWRAACRGLALGQGVNRLDALAVVKALEALGVRDAGAIAQRPAEKHWHAVLPAVAFGSGRM